MANTRKLIHCVSDGSLIGEREIYKPLLDAGFSVDFTNLESTQDEQAVVNAAAGYDYAIAGTEIWSRNVFEALRGSLKMLVRHGVGVDNVDIGAARELGVAVSNTPGANAGSVAEHALAMLLCLLRKISKYDREVRNGIWRREQSRPLSGVAGIIGFGAVGQAFAKLLTSFPVEVLAYDIKFNEKAARALGVKFAEPDAILSACDILSVHVPVTPATAKLIDGAFIGKMKADAVLINTSRGEIADEPALIAALRENRLAGAALDVFEREPIDPSNPLLAMDNVIITPHAAGMSVDALRRIAAQCAANILDFECGRGPDSLLT